MAHGSACSTGIGPLAMREVLHDEKRRLILLADVEERADVDVTQLGDGACLALEALTQVRSGGDVRQQRLDGDDAIEAGVFGLIDLAHSPGADGVKDFVRAEARASGNGHKRVILAFEGCRPKQ